MQELCEVFNINYDNKIILHFSPVNFLGIRTWILGMLITYICRYHYMKQTFKEIMQFNLCDFFISIR
jgi:hypothetical protein